MNPSPCSDTIATASAPTHDEIAQCARELWTESGRPEERDDAIWLEAERRLISARRPPEATADPLRTLPRASPSESAVPPIRPHTEACHSLS